MGTFVREGDVIEWTNGTGSDVAIGKVVAVGTYGYGVTNEAIANATTGEVSIKGVHTLPKYATSNAISQGAPVYFVLSTQLAYNA